MDDGAESSEVVQLVEDDSMPPFICAADETYATQAEVLAVACDVCSDIDELRAQIAEQDARIDKLTKAQAAAAAGVAVDAGMWTAINLLRIGVEMAMDQGVWLAPIFAKASKEVAMWLVEQRPERTDLVIHVGERSV